MKEAGDIDFINVDPVDPGAAETIRHRLELFRERHGARGRIVSFVPSLTDDRHDLGPVESWRVVFPQEKDFALWAEGYEWVDLAIKKVGARASTVLDTYYHESARDMYQCLVYRACVSSLTGPVAIIKPDGYFDSRSHRVSALVKHGLRIARQRILATIWIVIGPLIKLGCNFLESARAGSLPRAIRRKIRNLPRFLFRVGRAVCRRSFHLVCRIGRGFSRPILGLVGRFRSKQRPTRATAVLMTVEDSGTYVNLAPALKILEEFKSRGENVIVLTSGKRVVDDVRKLGLRVINVWDHESGGPGFRPRLRWMMGLWLELRKRVSGGHEGVFFRTFYFRAIHYRRTMNVADHAIGKLAEEIDISAVLTVYEALPLSMMAGSWAKARGIPWVGFFPVLLGNRPDCRHFPAPTHLVYGSQLTDLMVAAGCNPRSIVEVGSPTYESEMGRDKTLSRAQIENRFPRAVGKRVVVVATEAFPHPLIELDPILRALGAMDAVHVVVKVHPSDSLDFFERFVKSLPDPANIDVVKAYDLHALLSGADLLMAITSNIIITAAVLGTPTLVCDFSGKTDVLDFVAEGLAIGCHEPTEVGRSIESLLFDLSSRACALAAMGMGLARFNGPNDGRSVQRIVSLIEDMKLTNRKKSDHPACNPLKDAAACLPG